MNNNTMYYTRNKPSSLLMRSFIILVVYLLLALSYYYYASFSGAFFADKFYADSSEVVLWLISSVVLPSLINFIIAYVSSVYILPLSNSKYAWWITKNSIKNILFYYLISLTILCVISALYIANINSKSFIEHENSIMNEFQITLSYIPLIVATLIPLWLGYKAGWTSFVGAYDTEESFRNKKMISGTRTKQEMYVEYSQMLETKNIGQWWDKYLEKPFITITGKDGRKPKMFFLWFIFSLAIIFPFWSIGMQNTSEFIISITTFFISPLLILSHMVLSKFTDMNSSKHLPYLFPKVGYDNDSSNYDIDNIGHKKYERVI